MSSDIDKSNKTVSLLAGFGTKDVVNDVMNQASQVKIEERKSI